VREITFDEFLEDLARMREGAVQSAPFEPTVCRICIIFPNKAKERVAKRRSGNESSKNTWNREKKHGGS